MNGCARYYDNSFRKQHVYQGAEMTTHHETVGVQGYISQTTKSTVTEDGSGDIVIKNIHADVEGNDNENLNDEYVIFKNIGDESVKSINWIASDESPAGFRSKSGALMIPYTGDGIDTNDEL